jgi:hypothetical protein
MAKTVCHVFALLSRDNYPQSTTEEILDEAGLPASPTSNPLSLALDLVEISETGEPGKQNLSTTKDTKVHKGNPLRNSFVMLRVSCG